MEVPVATSYEGIFHPIAAVPLGTLSRIKFRSACVPRGHRCEKGVR